ncbi:hypothetical protein NCS52_00858800 [Fusarium sp. LHS14.1]|nr:hypothetical protein NCS52_00858800 [Fusarium sp. LHS14.1]
MPRKVAYSRAPQCPQSLTLQAVYALRGPVKEQSQALSRRRRTPVASCEKRQLEPRPHQPTSGAATDVLYPELEVSRSKQALPGGTKPDSRPMETPACPTRKFSFLVPERHQPDMAGCHHGTAQNGSGG